jgi:hypothetical protein
MLNARILTLLANITKKPPLLAMSIDQTRSIREGYVCEGSKSEKELDITYTPVRTAIEEAANARLSLGALFIKSVVCRAGMEPSY